jgi:hypothetical protein
VVFFVGWGVTSVVSVATTSSQTSVAIQWRAPLFVDIAMRGCGLQAGPDKSPHKLALAAVSIVNLNGDFVPGWTAAEIYKSVDRKRGEQVCW